jgi:hypothetical protein
MLGQREPEFGDTLGKLGREVAGFVRVGSTGREFELLRGGRRTDRFSFHQGVAIRPNRAAEEILSPGAHGTLTRKSEVVVGFDDGAGDAQRAV